MEDRGYKMDWGALKQMKDHIDQLEKLLLDLERLGQGLPVVEKNVTAMRSFAAVLHYGISDIVEANPTMDG